MFNPWSHGGPLDWACLPHPITPRLSTIWDILRVFEQNWRSMAQMHKLLSGFSKRQKKINNSFGCGLFMGFVGNKNKTLSA